MPTLHWVGKDKVVNHHHEVPFRVLKKVSAFRAPEGAPANSTDNRIIHGDNLEALKSLLPELEGRVKCIYIDPIYNNGNEGWVYNDAVNDPKMKRWLGQVVGKEGAGLRFGGNTGAKKPGTFVICADRCLLSPATLTQHGIIFKKIPRDITRF